MKLEVFGKILAMGFGDRVAIGAILGILNGVTPMRVYEYIRDDTELGNWVSDDEWAKYRQMIEDTNIGTITLDDIIEGLRKHRTDLLGIIISDPRGMDWLHKQADILKSKLGLENPAV